MTDQKTIDLLVRASIQGRKDLESVAKSIDEISASLEKQSAAAKRGENNLDELKGTLAALAQEGQKLADSQRLIKSFEDLGKKLESTAARADKAATAYADYRKELGNVAELTDKQTSKEERLAKQATNSAARLQKQRDEYQRLGAALSEAGINVDDLAGSQARLQATMGQQVNLFARTQNAISTYAQDVRAARDAEKSLAEDAAFQQKLKDAANLVKANDYVQFWTQSLNAAEQAEKELTANRSLGKMADDADKSARAFTTLAQASNNLRPNVVSLRDAVNAIVNPGQELRSTLNGVEQEVNALATNIAKIKGPVAEYRSTLASLENAQKAIGKQSGLVDDFRRQTEALRAARAEFSNARAQVTQYAAAVRQGGTDGQSFVKALADAQVRARGAAEALNAQLNATRQSREALRAAGIAANDLAGAEARLTTAARSTVTSTQALTAAVKEYGMAQDKASKTPGLGDGGRTTLSFVQRLRGEILSLTATYAGLYSAINTAKGALDAFSTRESVQNQLGLSVGNNKAAIDSEYAYIKAQSDRIGLEFDRTAKGFAKFSASATLAGRSRQEIRYVFESFSEAAKVMGVSADDLDGVFKALDQIYSKGAIQAEELKGQLADRLPGIFEVAQKALKAQFPDLQKAMEQGQVSSSALIKIAQEYRNVVAEQLPGAMKGLTAEQARLKNAVFEFQTAVADSGWVDAYKQALIVLVDFMKSADGQNAAKAFGQALVGLANGFTLVAKNLDTIIPLLEIFTAFFTVKLATASFAWLERIPVLLAATISATATAATAATGLARAWGLAKVAILGVLGAIAAGFAGWQIGEWAYEKFAIVRKAGTWLVTGLAQAWEIISSSYEAAFAIMPLIAKNAFAAVVNTVTFAARKMLGIFSSLASAVGLDNVAKVLTEAANAMTVGYADVGAVIAKKRTELDNNLKAIAQTRKEMLADNERIKVSEQSKAGAGRGVAQVSTATQFPDSGNGSDKRNSKDTDAAAKKLETLKEEITRALETLDAKIDRSQTETLSKQIDAIDEQYQALSRKIAKVGGETGKVFMEHLSKSIAELKDQTTNKFNQDLLKDQDALQNKLESARAAAGKKEKLDVEARVAAIRTSYEDAYRDITNLRLKLFANNRDTAVADEAKANLDASIAELQSLERIKFAKEELDRLEGRLNEKIKLRDQLVANVNLQKELGNKTDQQAAQEINRINAEALPGITAAAEETRKWAEENAKIFATPADKEMFLAQLEATRVKAAQVKTEFSGIQAAFINGFGKGIDTGLNSIFDGLEKVVQGQQSVSAGFQGILQSFLQFSAQFLREIAIMIAKQLIFNALKNSGNPFLAAAGAAGSASVKHAGGLVGHYGGTQRSRNVNTAWFANAPRYHSGGVPGLAADEYATILQKGEEVLSKDSPRNILNGGAMPAQGGGSSSTRFVLVDDRAKVHEAMATSDGEKVIVQALRRNLPTVKQMLRS